MWDENRERWLCLERLLREGKPGSKILVTTGSEVVAKNMGVIKPYVLNILPLEKSWALFKSRAFKDGQQETKPNLISTGKEIVKKCGNVPLAIRTIAGILYSKDTEEEWMHFRDQEIGMIEHTQNDIMPTLKVSYYHLVPQQKQCFAYCSLFPKDYTFSIKRLIQLWMAQGFVKSLDDGRICFLELLRRCFFQNVSRDEDDIETCQMHDLMHDLAQTVGDECLLVDGPQENVNNNVRHVHVVNPSWLGSQSSRASPHIRSYLLSRSYGFYKQFGIELNDIFSSLKRLRALDLGEPRYERLSDSIGELKHLRYLKVRVTSDYLPSGITKLQYLETLDLGGSTNLRELPTEFYKLTRLKYLQIRDKFQDRLDFNCKLVDMPPRFGELTSLQSLDIFVVGNNTGLDALSRLNLASKLEIYFKIHRQNAISEAKQANMKGKRLTVLNLTFNSWLSYYHREAAVEADELLECLEPPSTLKHLKVRNWQGVRFPNWGIDELPNLISLKMINCLRCRHLPPFGRLPHIKKLEISNCEELDLWDVKDEDDEGGKGNYVNSSSWACMKSLDSLSLAVITKLESLPSGIFGLTSLQKLSICRLFYLKTIPESIGQLTQLRCLEIRRCLKLEALPKSIQNLVGLQELIIRACPLLKPRCQKPDGDDWALIQHIPRKIV